jgi:hypothetical protein
VRDSLRAPALAPQLKRDPLDGRIMRPALFLLGTTLALQALACGDLREIISLQQGLTHEFHTGAINVNINNSVHLTVMFSNSAAGELPDSEQATFARHVAEYVRDHYAGYDHLETINIGFAKVTGGGPIKFTSSRVPYTFTHQDLGPSRAVPKGPAT